MRKMTQTKRDRWAYGTPAESKDVGERVTAGEFRCDRCAETAVAISRSDVGVRVFCRSHTLDMIFEPISDAGRDRTDAFRAGPRADG